MDSLTPEQVSRLEALLAELRQLPTPELLIEAGRLRLPMPLDEVGRKRFRQIFAGGVAAQKLLAYIGALEEVDDHRGAIGKRIFDLQQVGNRLIEQESAEAAKYLVEATYLAGRQEVDYHFFAVCVGRIERLLLLVARTAGYKIPLADKELLASYRALRDYYEHLEDRLPSGKRYDEALGEIEQNGEWRIRVSLGIDSQERIIIDGAVVDVTPRGVTAVREAVRRSWEQLGPSALALVRKHYEENPSAIPAPEEINQELFVSAAR